MSSEFAVQRREVLAHAARPQSEDDQALDRVGAAESLLDARGGGADLRRFFACLYGGAPPEDITRYSAESLVALANRLAEGRPWRFDSPKHEPPGGRGYSDHFPVTVKLTVRP